MVSSHLFIKVSSLLLVLALQCGSVSAAASPGPGTVIFARQNPECVQDCPFQSCENLCSGDTTCQMVAQTCTVCSFMKCVDKPKSTKKAASASVGAIVGGLFGGLAMAGIIGFLVYTRWIKKKKARMSMAVSHAAEKDNDFGMLKSARASTHTVASIASTVRTRASNVIQIAYIPGVTNRSGPPTPSHLVPPVPPLPGMSTGSHSPVTSQYPRSPLAGDFQFSADDILRGSMYTVNDNRSSVATTIYGQNAVVSQPNIIRACKAAVVTVKGGSSVGASSASSPLSESVPPMPTIVKIKGSKKGKGSGDKSTVDAVPPSPAFSVGSTFLNRMNSTKKSDGAAGSRAVHENHSASSFLYDTEDSDDDIQPGQRLRRAQSACSSCITDMDTGSPFSESRSPFSDTNTVAIDDLLAPANSGLPPTGHSRGPSMDAASTLRQVPERAVSPFDDSNTIDKPVR